LPLPFVPPFVVAVATTEPDAAADFFVARRAPSMPNNVTIKVDPPAIISPV